LGNNNNISKESRNRIIAKVCGIIISGLASNTFSMIASKVRVGDFQMVWTWHFMAPTFAG